MKASKMSKKRLVKEEVKKRTRLTKLNKNDNKTDTRKK